MTKAPAYATPEATGRGAAPVKMLVPAVVVVVGSGATVVETVLLETAETIGTLDEVVHTLQVEEAWLVVMGATAVV